MRRSTAKRLIVDRLQFGGFNDDKLRLHFQLLLLLLLLLLFIVCHINKYNNIVVR